MSIRNLFAGSLTVLRADEAVPAISPHAFSAGQAGHVVAMEAGEMALPPVQCHKISPGDVQIQRPLNMPAQVPGFLSKLAYPSLCISRLADAICLPGGLALADERRILLESFSAPWEADYHNALTHDGTGWHLRQRPEEMATFDPPALFIDYQHSAYFGHFIADSLSRCWAAEFCQAWLGTEIRHALITAPVPAFVTQFLQALDITAIPLPPNQAVRCRELIVAAKSFQIQEYIAPPAQRLWQRLRGRLAQSGTYPQRVFISRRRNPTRKLLEEEQVEALFAQHGFAIFCPEEHDIATQISVFAAAKLIAGCSGSNMFNIAFHGQAASVLILVSPLLVHYSEHLLAAGSTVTLSYFIGHVSAQQLERTPGYVHAPWHVDLAELAPYVAGWIARAA